MRRLVFFLKQPWLVGLDPVGLLCDERVCEMVSLGVGIFNPGCAVRCGPFMQQDTWKHAITLSSRLKLNWYVHASLQVRNLSARENGFDE